MNGMSSTSMRPGRRCSGGEISAVLSRTGNAASDSPPISPNDMKLLACAKLIMYLIPFHVDVPFSDIIFSHLILTNY